MAELKQVTIDKVLRKRFKDRKPFIIKTSEEQIEFAADLHQLLNSDSEFIVRTSYFYTPYILNKVKK